MVQKLDKVFLNNFANIENIESKLVKSDGTAIEKTTNVVARFFLKLFGITDKYSIVDKIESEAYLAFNRFDKGVDSKVLEEGIKNIERLKSRLEKNAIKQDSSKLFGLVQRLNKARLYLVDTKNMLTMLS